MTKIKHTTVLVTGGARGLGRLLAEKCLDEGAAKIVLWDIDEKQLYETAAELQKWGKPIITQVVDVSKPEEIYAKAEELIAEHKQVDILFNNAGIVVGKDFSEHSIQDIERTVKINISGVMHVARAFLPVMLSKKKGHIINIASAVGLMPNPKMSVYAGSKWAVIGWSESLRLELQKKSRKLKVTTIMPSYINTGMFDGVKAPLLTPIMKPDYIIKRTIKAVKRNEVMVQEPFMVKTIPVLRGVLPTRVFDFIAGDVFGVYKTMETFKGHEKKAAKTKRKK